MHGLVVVGAVSHHSVNTSLSYTFNNQGAALSAPAEVNVFVDVTAQKANDMLTAPS
jgi:hypothetical protein